MSKASRLAAASTRIMPPRDPRTGHFVRRPDPSTLGPQLALNTAGIPGALGFDLPAAVTVAGIAWRPEDGSPWASPIGAALAFELATS